METKYKFAEYGTTFTEKWNTNNQLSTTIDVQDKILKGLKLTFDSEFSPQVSVTYDYTGLQQNELFYNIDHSFTHLLQTGAKSGKVKAEYKHDLVTVNSDVDINLGGPLVNASAVVGHKGWLAGYQLAFDTGKSKLTKNNFCLGYSNGDFVLHTNVNDGQVFGGSVYQKVNPNLDTAVNLGKNPSWN